MNNLAAHLAIELEDYPECNPVEANQFAVDYPALPAKICTLTQLQAIALMTGIEKWFADQGETPITNIFKTI